jgi:hypothetical protein
MLVELEVVAVVRLALGLLSGKYLSTKRLQMKLPLVSIAILALLPGCASITQPMTDRSSPDPMMQTCSGKTETCAEVASVHPSTPVILRTAQVGARASSKQAHGNEVDRTLGAPTLEGQPLTSVVVTQCNLVVAIYMTMPDGRLLRFDQRAEVPAQELVTLAYTASRSERVEVACEGIGAAGFEAHGAI